MDNLAYDVLYDRLFRYFCDDDDEQHQAREKCIGENLSVPDMKDLGLRGEGDDDV